MIAKQVSQIHNSYERLGLFERASIERWRGLNPGWEYRFITEHDLDEYILDVWPQYADTYKEMSPMQRTQIMRAACVYQSGGVYADCDVYLIRPLENFLPMTEDCAWFQLKPRPDHKIYISDYFFAAAKGYEGLNQIIHECFERTTNRRYLIDDPEWGWTGYIYESVSIHAWSEIVVNQRKERLLAGGDNWVWDMQTKPDDCHIYHYSTESWIPDNRFKRDGKDPMTEEISHLNILKKQYGI
jgi:mannosyltransferase OCH1-like enzyme